MTTAIIAFMKSNWRVIAGFLLLFIVSVLVAGYGYQRGYSRADGQWQSKWQARDLADMQAAKTFTEQQRRIELQRQGDIDAIQEQAQQDIATAQHHAAVAAAESDRLQRGIEQAIAQLRAGGSDTSPTTSSKTRASTSSLLTVLFREIDTAAGEYAAEADRARGAGLRCEAAYDAVRGKK